jgi:hypothetical protein
VVYPTAYGPGFAYGARDAEAGAVVVLAVVVVADFTAAGDCDELQPATANTATATTATTAPTRLEFIKPILSDRGHPQC